MQSIKVEIIKGYEKVNSRIFPAKDGKPARAGYSQDAYFHFGGAFPVKATVPLDKPTQAYPVGDYILDPDCFGTNEYDQIKMSTFSMQLLNKDGSAITKVNGQLKNPNFVDPDSEL